MGTVQKRGAAVIAARKLSSAMSAAKAASDHMKTWVGSTPADDWVSMGVFSDGSHGRLPEVHGGVEGGGGLGLRSLLAVEPQCKYSSQMFALGSPTSANIHPDFYVPIVPAFAIYMQTISNKYYVLT